MTDPDRPQIVPKADEPVVDLLQAGVHGNGGAPARVRSEGPAGTMAGHLLDVLKAFAAGDTAAIAEVETHYRGAHAHVLAALQGRR